MFKSWRTKRKAARRRQDIAHKIDAFEKAYPEIAWQPFREVSDFFADKSISALEEQAFLYRLASGLPADAQVIEIGSWIGHGTSTLAAALKGPNARVFAVDAFACWSDTPGENAHYTQLLNRISPGRSQREIFDSHLAHLGLQKRVQTVVGDSRQAAPHVPLSPGSADLIFVDGGHDLDTVRHDTTNFLPFVKPGGVAAFHDFSSLCGVPTALWEAIQRQSFGDLIGIHNTLIAFRTR